MNFSTKMPKFPLLLFLLAIVKLDVAECKRKLYVIITSLVEANYMDAGFELSIYRLKTLDEAAMRNGKRVFQKCDATKSVNAFSHIAVLHFREKIPLHLNNLNKFTLEIRPKLVGEKARIFFLDLSDPMSGAASDTVTVNFSDPSRPVYGHSWALNLQWVKNYDKYFLTKSSSDDIKSIIAGSSRQRVGDGGKNPADKGRIDSAAAASDGGDKNDKEVDEFLKMVKAKQRQKEELRKQQEADKIIQQILQAKKAKSAQLLQQRPVQQKPSRPSGKVSSAQLMLTMNDIQQKQKQSPAAATGSASARMPAKSGTTTSSQMLLQILLSSQALKPPKMQQTIGTSSSQPFSPNKAPGHKTVSTQQMMAILEATSGTSGQNVKLHQQSAAPSGNNPILGRPSISGNNSSQQLKSILKKPSEKSGEKVKKRVHWADQQVGLDKLKALGLLDK